MKASYKKQITKDDQLFLNHAKRVLREDWGFVWSEAMDKYKSIENAQEAKREANLIILKYLTEIGENHWREPDRKPEQDKPRRITINKDATLPESTKRKHWTGKSILEMGDEKLQEMHKKSK